MRLPRCLSLSAAVLAAGLLGSALAAQDGSARLSGAVNGESATWHVVDIGDASGSFWADMGTLHQVSVMAFSDPEGRRIEGAVEFSLTLDSRTDPMGVLDAHVTWYGEDLRRPYAVPPDREERVTAVLDDSRIEGNRLYLQGRLATPLLRLVDATTDGFDPDDSVEFDLEFEISVERL